MYVFVHELTSFCVINAYYTQYNRKFSTPLLSQKLYIYICMYIVLLKDICYQKWKSKSTCGELNDNIFFVIQVHAKQTKSFSKQ